MGNVIGFFIGLTAGGMMGALVMALIEEELRRKNNANGTGTVSEGLETDSKGDKGSG